jgi:hypothetical protein
LGDRSDLLVGELLKLLGGLPNVGDEQPVVGRRDPVKQAAGRAHAPRREAHLLDDLIVLLKRCACELHNGGDRHDVLLSEDRARREPSPSHRSRAASSRQRHIVI